MNENIVQIIVVVISLVVAGIVGFDLIHGRKINIIVQLYIYFMSAILGVLINKLFW